jgi:biotin carboxyl carrier protein
MQVTIGNRRYEIQIIKKDDKFYAVIDGRETLEVLPEVSELNEIRTVIINRRKYWINIEEKTGEYIVNLSLKPYVVKVVNELHAGNFVESKRERETLYAPLSGLVIKLIAKPGTVVKKNEHLLTIEAMKMQNEILSPIEGRILNIYVKEGDKLEKGNKLLDIEPLTNDQIVCQDKTP